MSFCIFVNKLESRKHCPGFRLGDFVLFEGINSGFEGGARGKIFLNVY